MVCRQQSLWSSLSTEVKLHETNLLLHFMQIVGLFMTGISHTILDFGLISFIFGSSNLKIFPRYSDCLFNDFLFTSSNFLEGIFIFLMSSCWSSILHLLLLECVTSRSSWSSHFLFKVELVIFRNKYDKVGEVKLYKCGWQQSMWLYWS